MIEYLAAGGVGTIIGGWLVWLAKDADRGARVTEAVLAEQARGQAKAQAAYQRGYERGTAVEREAGERAITRLQDTHAREMAAAIAKAYQEGKESDGVVRNAKGQMESVKKAPTAKPKPKPATKKTACKTAHGKA